MIGQQRRVDPVAVAAVAQLAVELVDEVAAVGEDQDAAGARGLDEPERGDRLPGAGRVLEPEAAVGVRVLGLLVELDVRVELGLGVLPVLGLLVLLLGLPVLELELVLELLAGIAVEASSAGSSSAARAVAGCAGGCEPVGARAVGRRPVALLLGEQRGQGPG